MSVTAAGECAQCPIRTSIPISCHTEEVAISGQYSHTSNIDFRHASCGDVRVFYHVSLLESQVAYLSGAPSL